MASAWLTSAPFAADPVTVRYREGVVHGFLVLRSLDGQVLAGGELLQVPRGDRVTSRMVMSFKDGSLHDETAVFRQDGRFRLLSYRLVQKGPSFSRPMEVVLDGDGPVIVRHTDDDGEQKVESERVEVPADLANGIVPILLKNGSSGAPLEVSFLAATPKPRLVKLVVSSAGEDSFTVAGQPRKARHYVVKVEIGGVKGMIAPLVGKQPPDTHVWIATGEAPGFVRSEGPLFVGGPIWRIELAGPVWPEAPATDKPS
jgi:hypothetical protein